VADLTTRTPGRVPAARPARMEPSWGRVLLTTVELWVSRRSRPQKTALALVAAAAAALAALQLTGAFTTAAPRAAATATAGTRAAQPAVTAHPAARGASSNPSATASSATGPSATVPSAAAQSAAVAWMTSQVSSAAAIGCYPALCAALQAQGVSASRLVPLGSNLAGVLTATVIATLPSADQKLADRYAPALIASFGNGGSRIEIRAVARDGAAAYQSAARADLAARTSAGAQLRRNPRIRFSATDAARLLAGEVDTRLLATLAGLSSEFTFQVTAFGDSSPGAPLLFRQVSLVVDGHGNGPARLAAALAMAKAQEGPYLPARAAIVRPGTGQALLVIEFAAPSPLGLLTPVIR
jgi:hypothetical protein